MKSQRQARFKLSKVATVSLAVALVFGFGFLAGYYCSRTPGGSKTYETERAEVMNVVDGDTITLRDGRSVRYLGIDTPETGEPYGGEATDKNKEFVQGQIVEMQRGIRDKDKYGRILRYVYIDGTFVNAELVAQGYARAYIFDQNERYSQVLVQLEQYAKFQKKGIWGNSN